MNCPNCKTKLEVSTSILVDILENDKQLESTNGMCFSCGCEYAWKSVYQTKLVEEYGLKKIVY